MRRTVQHFLFSFLLIGALLLDMSGSFANGCSVGSSSACCSCCNNLDGESGSCCCSDDAGSAEVCTCGCSTPQVPATPPSSPTDENRVDYQRTVVLKVELPAGDGDFQAVNAEQSPLSALQCATRRRAILCCWVT